MTEKLTKEQKAGILQALDEALSKAPWDASTFLSLIGKKLQSIRDELAETLDNHDHDTEGSPPKLNQQTVADRYIKMKKVYIALYAIDGSNLQSWERILQHLPKQVISRPVYENEEDVMTSIRSKSNRLNEAFAAIYVEPQYILSQSAEKISVDRLGKPLLALKDKAINLENVDVFVHQSGTYRFVGGRLIKK